MRHVEMIICAAVWRSDVYTVMYDRYQFLVQ